VDKSGNYYVADAGNGRVQKFLPNGNFVWKKDGLNFPMGILVDFEGKIIVTEYGGNCISIFNPDLSLYLKIGEEEGKERKFFQPCDITLSASGQIIVCDSGNHRVSFFE